MGIVIGLGEILWDVLPEGRKLGGAPANFAYHVNALGGRGVPVSRVGDDDLGHEALSLLRRRGLDVSHVTLDPDHPTGTVIAELDDEGKASYVFPPDVAWDYLEIAEDTVRLAPEVDAVCFGSLAQRSQASRKAMHDFLDFLPNDSLKVFDINLRGDFYTREVMAESLELANVLKVSDEELPVLADAFGLKGDDAKVLEALAELFSLQLCALTRGSSGSLLLRRDGRHDHPGEAATVVDTIGAGDSFTAAMVLGMLAGWPLGKINERANLVAAAVCAQAGAMVEVPRELVFRKSA